VGLAIEKAFCVSPNDINRKRCEAYFNACEAEDSEPCEPYWDKWKFFAKFFDQFYSAETEFRFTEAQPWTLFEMPELKLVVAGLNSTMKESHRDEDHHGWLGEKQLRRFAERLQEYQDKGWFRVAALHHNLRRGPVQDDENLRDAEDFKKRLGDRVNLVVHGHTHDGKADWLGNKVPILSTGSAVIKAQHLAPNQSQPIPLRPEETPNQYQIVQLWPDRFMRWTRAYYPKNKTWGGDNRASENLDAWRAEEKASFADVQAAFPAEPPSAANGPVPPPQPDSALPDEELRRYLAAAENAHKEIRLAGFKTRLRAPIDLEALHVPLRAMADVRGNGACRFADAEEAEAKLGRDGAAEIALIDAFKEAQARRRRRHLVILGDPGAGKTTHLQSLLLASLRKGPQSLGLAEGTIPVFLPLRDLDDFAGGIAAFIEKTLDSPHLNMPSGCGRRLLERGRLLLLFDGLDEVSDAARRAQVARWIESALRDWPHCTAVVTCRFAGYDEGDRLDPSFLELHLRPLSQEQAERFVRNWYRTVETGLTPGPSGEIKAAERAEALLERLRGPDFRSARMATLTRNPLLLTNLCLVHRDRGGILPKGRHRLYEECIEALLERWREAKLRKDGTPLGVSVPAEVGRQALQPAALWLHGQEGRTRASAEELAPMLEPALQAARWEGGDARRFLNILRDESGLLTGWSHERYGFMHLGFQEYLAACAARRLAVEQAFQGGRAALAELAGHYGESWWQEVILLLLAQGNPSLFAPFMREALAVPGFEAMGEMTGLILEEAAEVTAAPFLELARQAPGGDASFWERQFAALRLLERLLPEAEFRMLAAPLSDHPLLELQSWVRERLEFAVHTPRISMRCGVGVVTVGRANIACVSANGGVELVYIPGGRFRMGSPDGMGDDDERPAHEASIRPFYLGRYPVTNEEYARFLKAHPEVEQPACWADRRFNQGRQPAVGVNWEQARRFARWAGGRLPSEAEWEYAARAGSVTEYFWGESAAEADEYAWHSGNSRGATHPVGEKRPNAFGLHDMAGNVWEWVQDRWHENYRGAPADGAAWEEGESARRVVRGGAWSDVPQLWRSANRDRYWLGGAGNVLGFRLARDI
jgi:formylglycine-generating enzyme required for sulfatase activity